MLPDRVSNPGPLTYESGALPIALRGPTRNRDQVFHLKETHILIPLSRPWKQPVNEVTVAKCVSAKVVLKKVSRTAYSMHLLHLTGKVITFQ